MIVSNAKMTDMKIIVIIFHATPQVPPQPLNNLLVRKKRVWTKCPCNTLACRLGHMNKNKFSPISYQAIMQE